MTRVAPSLYDKFVMRDEHQLKRWFPRRKVNLPCTVIWQDRQVRGKTVDVSYTGLGVLLSEAVDVNVEAKVQIPEGIWLRVQPVYLRQRIEMGRGTRSVARSNSSSGGSNNG